MTRARSGCPEQDEVEQQQVKALSGSVVSSVKKADDSFIDAFVQTSVGVALSLNDRQDFEMLIQPSPVAGTRLLSRDIATDSLAMMRGRGQV